MLQLNLRLFGAGQKVTLIKIGVLHMNVHVKSNAYEPQETDEYMNAKHIEYFSDKLRIWKESIYREYGKIAEDLKKIDFRSTGSVQYASASSNSMFYFRRSNRYKKLLDKIELAFLRIKDGSYGYCIKTGKKIGLSRLKARPIATMAIEAQENREEFERQHKV